MTLSAKGTLHFRKLSIQNTAATFDKELDTDEKTGEYSVYLAPDKYQLSVIVSTEEKTKGLQWVWKHKNKSRYRSVHKNYIYHKLQVIQKFHYSFRFYPLQQTIDVTSQPITNVNFLQLKAILTGTVNCLSGTDCSQASVTLKILDGVTIKTVQAKGELIKVRINIFQFFLTHCRNNLSCNNKYMVLQNKFVLSYKFYICSKSSIVSNNTNIKSCLLICYCSNASNSI